MKVKVKKKKVLHSFYYFYEQLFQENKDLRVQVAHLQEELDTYKKQSNSYWEERAIVLSRENEELKQKLTELEK